MTIEGRVREIISPSIDEWIGQKIDTAELERRKELARQQAVAEDSGGSTAAAAALLAAALEAAAANPNLNPKTLTLRRGLWGRGRGRGRVHLHLTRWPVAAVRPPTLSRFLVPVHALTPSPCTHKATELETEQAPKPSRGWAIIKKPSDSSSHLAANNVATLPASSKV